jgi:hypothetical protein
VPPDDFFDEDWEEPRQTQETAVTRPAGGAPARPPETGERPPRNGGRIPRMPRVQRGRPGGHEQRGPRPPRTTIRGSQLEYGRLAILGAGILVVVLVAWWALNRGGGGVSPTERYFQQVRAVDTQSDAIGAQFQKLLVTPGATADKLRGSLQQQLTKSKELLAQAQAIKPTSELAAVHPFLLQALQYRVTGLQCLVEDVVSAAKQKSKTGSKLLSTCAQRLLASDVVYADSYSAGAVDALRAHHIIAQVPTSQFLQPQNANLVTGSGFVPVLGRIGKQTASGRHGVLLVSVVAVPSGKTLTKTGLTTVVASQDLKFRVSVQDSGDFQEVGVKVRLKFTGGGAAPVTRSGTIDSIDKGQTTSILIPASFTQSQIKFAQPYTLKVTAGPVPHEKVFSNNIGTYRISFLLSSS